MCSGIKYKKIIFYFRSLGEPKSNEKRKQELGTSIDNILLEQPHLVSELLTNALKEAEELLPNNKKTGIKRKNTKKSEHFPHPLEQRRTSNLSQQKK